MKGIGQNFDGFMIEQGLYEEAQERFAAVLEKKVQITLV